MDEGWHCANCGKPFKEGDEVVNSASGEYNGDFFEMGDHFYMHSVCPGDEKTYIQIIVGTQGGLVHDLEAWGNERLAWSRFKMLCEAYEIEDWEENESGVVSGSNDENTIAMHRLEWVHTEWPEHWEGPSETITSPRVRIELAIEDIQEYIPEFVLYEDKETLSDGQVSNKPGRIYHPESSVNSFREDLINRLKHGKLGVETVIFRSHG